jgi:sarcosine oxidase subunit gamma
MVERVAMAERQSNLPELLEWRGVRCVPVEPMVRFVLRGGADVFRKAGEAIGVDFPTALRASVSGKRNILWQGPDEFLLLLPCDERVPLHTALEKALAHEPHSLVDISHRNIALSIEGELVESLLATGIMLDLSTAAFPIGMTTRTLFGKADVTLWRQKSARFHLEAGRSFAPYVVGLLKAGASDL